MLSFRSLVVGVIAIAVVATVWVHSASFKTQPLAAAGRAAVKTAEASLPKSTVHDDRRARLVAVMGDSSLDLRQVRLASGEQMFVNVVVANGHAVVRIPASWVLDTSAFPLMGSIEQGRAVKAASKASAADGAGAPASGPPPRLVLRGVVLMGKVEVVS
jgi:hypothetical protein